MALNTYVAGRSAEVCRQDAGTCLLRVVRATRRRPAGKTGRDAQMREYHNPPIDAAPSSVGRVARRDRRVACATYGNHTRMPAAPSLAEQLGDGDLERREQLFGERFLSRQNAFQHQTIFAPVIHFHVVIARIDHPEAWDIQLFVNLLFHHRIRAMVIGADDLGDEPDLAGRRGDQSEVGPHHGARSDLHDRAAGQQARGGNLGQADGDQIVQPRTNQLVTPARRHAQIGFALDNLFVRLAHEPLRNLRRNLPVCERLFFATSSGVPAATICPPPSPPSGPRSINQSASAIKSRLCSMTMTEWPASTRRGNTSTSRRTSAMCNPMVGSSSMNRFRFSRESKSVSCSFKPDSKWVTSFTRWASPPLSVGLVCPGFR